jgi:hypothetical protein
MFENYDSLLLYVIWRFRREVAENCPFLGYDAVVSGTYYCPQFITFILKSYEEVELIYNGKYKKKSFPIIKPISCTNFSNFFWKWNSTCFG